MDPITLIVTALVAGAALTAKGIGAQAVKDGYAGLKTLIVRKFGGQGDMQDAIEQVEKKPDSEGRKATLQEELLAAGADKDVELARQAQAFLDLLKQPGSYSATVTGSGAIAQGPGAVAAGAGGVAIGGNVDGDITLGTQIAGDLVQGDKVMRDKISKQINTVRRQLK